MNEAGRAAIADRNGVTEDNSERGPRMVGRGAQEG